MHRRNTIQRTKILEHLRSVRTHPTAEEVYAAVKRSISSITLATVYRNLNTLADEGEILRIESGGKFRFDGFTHVHQHCVCDKCGKMVDVPEDNYSLKCCRAKGFKARCVCILFKGVCKDCA